MALKKSLCLAASLSLIGCQERLVPEDVEHEFHTMTRQLGTGPSHSRWNRLYGTINAYTNESVRQACYKFVFEKVHEFRFVQGDYKRQSQAFAEINSYASFEPAGGPSLCLSMEDLYALYLRHLAWMRDQLDVWRPKRPIDFGRISTEECREWEDWRDNYRYCRVLYDAMIAQLERRIDMYCTPDKASEEEKLRIKKMVADFLGRPIRSREQTIAERQAFEKSEERKAIRRGEVGP